MFEFLSFSGINWLAVGLAIVWALLQGFVWYSFLFRRTWNRANGREPDAPMVPPGPIALLTAVFAAVMVLTIAVLANTLLPPASGPRAINGLVLGLWLAAGLVILPLAGYTIWERRGFTWFLVPGSEQLVKIAGIGLILGLLP
jgi:hypothetical protein